MRRAKSRLLQGKANYFDWYLRLDKYTTLVILWRLLLPLFRYLFLILFLSDGRRYEPGDVELAHFNGRDFKCWGGSMRHWNTEGQVVATSIKGRVPLEVVDIEGGSVKDF